MNLKVHFKLKVESGKVNFVIRTGKDLVQNSIPEQTAKHLMDTLTVTKSDIPDYPIALPNGMNLQGEWKEEEVEEVEPKQEAPKARKEKKQ